MLPQETVRRKRDGETLSAEAIAEFVDGITDGSITDAQIAAFGMAVYFSGLSREETIALTLAMRDSGDVLSWQGIEHPVADKHSTGGVGDNVSLMLAPIAAACGLAVPMISGRGLGHTGGTLDKMEAIPGYTTQPDNALFRRVVDEVGCAIIGQTANLAPADKRFYGVRDVTATVESIPLITASILSKKLAAGLGSLVLDVKFGDGAFMTTYEKAKALAETLVDVADGAGTRTTALLTDMNQPLASAAGNAVEVRNAVQFLTGASRDSRLETVTLALAADMLMVSGHETDHGAAHATVKAALDNGRAADLFARMVHELGGPADFIERHDSLLPQAPLNTPVAAASSGYVSAIEARDIGIAVVEMGGGRRTREDEIDHSVGLSALVPVGTSVGKGDPIAMIHARDETSSQAARNAVLRAYTISSEKPETRHPVAGRIGEG
ncbi:thymidine phosphorylase [Oricola cellulosilytica]|uniref:Thymidine phosphorylase n=1 Tax=Oricola cellulosilytica TaxID=1429082 RepID=A0A4R0PHN6_9HYPH|nr:thymidine phosphorylase [Oricola cellulosilytica]TCD16090.1 thymidine phosphorylase [Oricola cellulosilytica]